jgi:hypothetical protein
VFRRKCPAHAPAPASTKEERMDLPIEGAFFTNKLRASGLTEEQIVQVCEALDDTCHHCWNADASCQCWNDV